MKSYTVKAIKFITSLISLTIFFSVITGGWCSSNNVNPVSPPISGSKDTTYILKTTDGGSTWHKLLIKGAAHIDKLDNGFAIGYRMDTTAYQKINSVATFFQIIGDSAISLPTPSMSGQFITDFEINNGDIWLTTSHSKLYKTTNFGTTWYDISGPFNGGYNGANDIEFQGGMCLVCKDSNIYFSSDYGASWKTTYLYSSSLKDVQFINKFGYTYAISYDGFVYKSMDNGSTWGGGQFIGYGQLNATNSDEVGGVTYQIIVGDLGSIIRSIDAGGTWQIVNQPTGAANLVKVTTNGVNWFAIGGNEIWTGSPDATTWTKYSYPDYFRYFQYISFVDTNTGYIVGY